MKSRTPTKSPASPPAAAPPERSAGPESVHQILSERLLIDGLPLVFDLEKSRGSWVFDSRSGERFLDFFTFFASLPVGFNHPELLRPEWEARFLRAARHKPSNSDAYTEELASFVAAFAELAAPPGFPHLFFVEGGTLAVENALKVAFDWKTRKNRAAGLSAEGQRVLHFREAFHGRSGYSLSLTNTDPVKTDLFPKFDWPRVSNPKLVFPLDAREEGRVEAAERAALEEIEQAFRRHPGEIAAIIIEPIQGEGGDNHFRGEFLRALRQAADREEAMLICDEVQCGFGITGRMWAFQHFGVEPDLVAFGKKSQVCGIMANRRVDEVPDNVFRIPSRINSTWGGNLADMVRCEAYLKIIQRERLVENAARTGAHLLQGLEETAAKSGGRIDNVRGRGLMCAFDTPSEAARAALLKQALEERLLILPCGKRSVRLRPPLNLSLAEADEGVSRLGRALARLS
jgi:L-lysine 6-transaminase